VANPVPRFAQCPADYSRKKVRLKDAMVCPAAKEGSASSGEIMEKQKMRSACKMEIVDFYSRCRARLSGLTKRQNGRMKHVINADHGADKIAQTIEMFGHERDKELSSWSQRSEELIALESEDANTTNTNA